MQSKNLLLLIALIIVLLIASLGTAPSVYADKHVKDKITTKEVQKEIDNVVDVIKNYTADKKLSASAKIEVALNSMDARIDAMEARIDKKWDKMNKAAREKARRTLSKIYVKKGLM